MAQIIKIKRSTGSSAPGTLAVGELAYSKGSDTLYVGDPATANTPIAIGPAIKNNAGTAVLATGITAAEIRTLAGVDAAGTDNSTVANLRTNLTAISDSTTIGDGTDVTITTSGALTVTGNLTVNGTTTTVNSTTTTVDDPIFTLGGDSAPGSDDNKDRGLEFRWHNGSAAKVGFFGYDDSAGKFTFIPDATNSSEVFSGTAGTIVADLEGDVTGDVTGNVSGTAGSATGNAATATALATARTIGGTSFDGTANIVPATVTIADESSDTTCFPLFVTAATGDLAPKSGSNLAFNSSSGALTATSFVGALTGNVTGNASGTAATVTTAAQPAITSLGTLTALTVDNLGVNGNTITANSGALNLTPASGSAIVLDGTISVDAGVVTGATSITSTAFVGALTIGGHTVDDIDIGTEFTDADDHLMSAGAIKEKIEAYGYSTTTGDITAITVSSTDASVTGTGTTSSGAATFDLQVGTIDGGTY